MNIAIIGFGNFGQFLAKKFIEQGHTVLACSRSNYTSEATSMGAIFVGDTKDLSNHSPDVLLLATSILSLEQVVRSLPLEDLKDCLFVDVLSVKSYPKEFLKRILPNEADILCTHPMFGPDSGKLGWENLPFMYDAVRIKQENRFEEFLEIFEKAQCKHIQMSSEEHDEYAASSQFITHTTGRLLEKLHLKSTPINTKGYEQLLGLIENTVHDSFDLYYGLFQYNPNSKRELAKIEQALLRLKNQLFDKARHLRKTTMIGIQGGEGSFNHEASLQLIEKYGYTNVELQYLITSESVLEALNDGLIDFGVFAIENSGSGTVLPSIFSMSKYPHEIIEIHRMSLTQCLLTKEGQDITTAKQIITHPQAIKQCIKTLESHYPHLSWDYLSDDYDTAECAKRLSREELPEDTVVIASKTAAQKYGLTIAHEGLNDDPENHTSFVFCKRRSA